MTPKEKASKLVSEYLIHFVEFYNEKEYGYNNDKAKECALIAVDEILFSNNTIFETNIPHECWKYWIEVKQEIEKL
jgi:hypothetical protein